MTPLRKRMIQDMKIRNLSPRTQKRYVQRVAAFARFFGKCPSKLGPSQIRAYQLHMIERKVSSSHLNVTVSALKFLYRVTLGRKWDVERVAYARREKKLPVVLSEEELLRFFSCVNGMMYRALLMTAFSAGLRVSEVVRLKVADIDSKRMMIRVQEGKGCKDRYVMLSGKLLEILRQYWKRFRPTYWLFPSPCSDKPISAAAVRRACNNAWLLSGLAKKVTPHTLRHTFATLLLESGVNLRVIQVLLGHRSPACTARYTRVETKHIHNTQSPLDSLPQELLDG